MTCLILGAVACGDTKVDPVQTTTTFQTITSTASQTSTTEPASTTTSTNNDEPDGESIGVTDKVTIVVTDPRDDE